MAIFTPFKFTSKGLDLEYKAQTGKVLKFSRFVLGDGYNTDSIRDLTSLVNFVRAEEIVRMQITGSGDRKKITIGFDLDTSKITDGFYLREIGIMAIDPDTQEEILMFYTNAGETADYISNDTSSTVTTKLINAEIYITDVEEITAVIDSSLVYALSKDTYTKTEVDEKVKTIEQTIEYTIAQELEYIQKDVKNLDNELDSLSPIQTVSGEELHFNNKISYELMSLKGEGKSEQFTTTGKNLIDLTQLNANTPISMKVSACDKSNVKSNSITLTAGGTWSNLFFVFPENYFAKNEDIVVCANFLETIAGRTSPVGFVISGSNNNVDYTEIKRAYPINAEYNKSTFISLTANVETYKYIRIRIWINSTATEVTPSESVVNVSEVMIARGTDDTYEPYTGGASPNPDYPQEIKTIQAYNLFNKDNVNTLYGFLDHTEKVFTLGNTAKTLYIECKENTTYTISKTLGARFRTATSNIIPNGGEKLNVVSHDGSKKVTLTTNAGDKYLLVYYYSLTYDTTITEQEILSSIQIVEGNMPKSYVPYGCIPYVGRGKNLLNLVDTPATTKNGITYLAENQKLKINGTGTSGTYSWLIITNDKISYSNGTPSTDRILEYSNGIISKGKVSLSKKVLNGSSTYDTVLHLYNELGKEVTTTNEDTKIVAVGVYLGGAQTHTDYTIELQLERGDTSTDYEPYHESTLPINLQGNELASVGTVSDKLLIDRKGNVAIEKHVGKVVLNGSENWSRDGLQTGCSIYSFTTNAIRKLAKESCICVSDFLRENGTDVYWKDTIGVQVNWDRYLRVKISENITTLEELKSWLQENNVTVYYELSTPELISLGTIENPKTFEGVNNVIVETNLGYMNVEVKYVQYPYLRVENLKDKAVEEHLIPTNIKQNDSSYEINLNIPSVKEYKENLKLDISIPEVEFGTKEYKHFSYDNLPLLHSYDMAYGNGIYILSGFGSSPDYVGLARSTDGRNWTPCLKSNSSISFYNVIFDGKKFVTVSSKTVVYTSLDGITWETPETNLTVNNTTSNETHLFYLNSKYFISRRINIDGTNTSEVFISNDCITWNKCESGGTIYGIDSMAYGNNIYVGTQGSYMYSSTDGITWTRTYDPEGTSSPKNVIFIDNKFIASFTSSFIISEDGVNWTISESEQSVDLFFKIGDLYFGKGGSTIYSSTDLITWKTLWTTNATIINKIVCINNEIFILITGSNYINKSIHTNNTDTAKLNINNLGLRDVEGTILSGYRYTLVYINGKFKIINGISDLGLITSDKTTSENLYDPQFRNIQISRNDLVPGVTPLDTGTIYFVWEY